MPPANADQIEIGVMPAKKAFYLREFGGDDDIGFIAKTSFEAFPANERTPLPCLGLDVIEGISQILLAKLNGVPLGFAIVRTLKDVQGWAYLQFLATGNKHRGKGLGSNFMRAIIHHLETMGCDHLVFEIEIPGEGDNLAQRKMRARFYERLGVHRIDYRFVTPSEDDPMKNNPFQLVVRTPPSLKKVEKKLACNLVKALLTEVYELEENHSLIDSNLKAIPEDGLIFLPPLGDTEFPTSESKP